MFVVCWGAKMIKRDEFISFYTQIINEAKRRLDIKYKDRVYDYGDIRIVDISATCIIIDYAEWFIYASSPATRETLFLYWEDINES